MEFKQCTKCILDTSASEISFDENGVCNFCNNFSKVINNLKLNDPVQNSLKLKKCIDLISNHNKNGKYNCILGLSGGVDSSYLAYLCFKYKLRPLVVHFDNGWNSELAVKNIELIINRFNYDLKTYVMNWEEFKDLQRSYLIASVIDIEIPTDQLIFGALNKIASKYGIKYILSGFNLNSEGIMPSSWIYNKKFDYYNLKSIHKRFGKVKLKTLPKFGQYQQHFYYSIKGISTLKLLNYIDYNKEEAKKYLISEIGWKDYGGKHYESLFTKFYQGYILPTKFNVDKRKAHLSTLINSNQLSKKEALKIINEPPYPLHELNNDKEYILKKLEFTEEEFNTILATPKIDHLFYGTETNGIRKLAFNTYRYSLYPFIRFLRFVKILNNPINI